MKKSSEIEFNCVEDLVLYIESRTRRKNKDNDKFINHLNKIFNTKQKQRDYSDRYEFLSKFNKENWDNFQISLKSKRQKNCDRDKSQEYLSKLKTIKSDDFICFQPQDDKNTRGVPKQQKRLVETWTQNKNIEPKFQEIFNEIIMNKFSGELYDNKNPQPKNSITVINNKNTTSAKTILKNKQNFNWKNNNSESLTQGQENSFVLSTTADFNKKPYTSCLTDKYSQDETYKNSNNNKHKKIVNDNQDPRKSNTHSLQGKRSKEANLNENSEIFTQDFQLNYNNRGPFMNNTTSPILNQNIQEDTETYSETPKNKLASLYKEKKNISQNVTNKSDSETNSQQNMDKEGKFSYENVSPNTETYIENDSDDKKTNLNYTELDQQIDKSSKKSKDLELNQVKIENALSNEIIKHDNNIENQTNPIESQTNFIDSQNIENSVTSEMQKNIKNFDQKVMPCENLISAFKDNKSHESIEIVESLDRSDKDNSIIVKSENEQYEKTMTSTQISYTKSKKQEIFNKKSILESTSCDEYENKKDQQCSFKIDKDGQEFSGNLTPKKSALMLEFMKVFRGIPSKVDLSPNNIKIEPNGKT